MSKILLGDEMNKNTSLQSVLLKVSKSQKQIMMSLILPKNERITLRIVSILSKKIEEKNSVKPVLAGLEMKAQAGQKIGQ